MTESFVTRRKILQQSLAGSLLATVVGAGGGAAAQGGTGYVKKGQLRGKNNPEEPRFKIVEPLYEEAISPGCTGKDAPETYMTYKIRCPNYPGGGGNGHNGHNDNGHSDTSDSANGCPGGSGGRRIYLNPNRHVATGLDELYRFVRTHQCWESEPEGEHDHDDDEGHQTKYYRVTFKPAR